MTKRILYALSSAVLLALPWMGAPAITLLVAFVPLLMLQQQLADEAAARSAVPVKRAGKQSKAHKDSPSQADGASKQTQKRGLALKADSHKNIAKDADSAAGKKRSAKTGTKGQSTKTTNKRRLRSPRLWPYLVLTFALWWLLTTWWVANAAVVGVVAATVVGTLLNVVAFMIYHAVWRRAPRALAYTLFVAAWIAYEYLYICLLYTSDAADD